MLVTLTERRTLEIYFGDVTPGIWDNCAQLFECNSHNLCGHIGNFIFVNFNILATIRCQKSETVPYVLVLEGKNGKRPTASNVKSATECARAYVSGIEAHHLYCV